MTIEVLVYLPGSDQPVDLNGYAEYLATVAASDTPDDGQCLPDELHYDNPREGTSLSITTETNDMESN